MKTPKFALAASALAVFARGAWACDDVAALAVVAATSAAPSSMVACSLTLSIERPTGTQLRLAFKAGEGWRFVDRVATDAPISFALNGNSAALLAELTATDPPETVLIDGPTGYAFAWIRDSGWVFVGRIADQPRQE